MRGMVKGTSVNFLLIFFFWIPFPSASAPAGNDSRFFVKKNECCEYARSYVFYNICGMNNFMLIRKAYVDDLSHIMRITKISYEHSYKMGTPMSTVKEVDDIEEQFLQEKFFALVAEVDEKIVGAVRYKFLEGNKLYFYRLAVLKEYRQKGCAALLIEGIEKIARERKCKKTLLDCMQEKKLVPYYEKFGFVVDKIKKHQDHYDVFMSKIL